MEAVKLKSMPTKVVVLGIGSSIDQDELNNIASSPADTNVLLAQNFDSLTDVEELLTDASCSGLWPSVILQ